MEDLVLASIIDNLCKEKGFEIRPIPTFSGDYFASSHGNVYSYKLKKWRELKPSLNSHGYLTVKLYSLDIRKIYKVHRLVLWSFVGQSDLHVNHINGIQTDNSLENLEYISNSENALHAYKIGLRKKKCGQPSGHDHWTKKKKALAVDCDSDEFNQLVANQYLLTVQMAHGFYYFLRDFKLVADELNRFSRKSKYDEKFDFESTKELLETEKLCEVELALDCPLGLSRRHITALLNFRTKIKNNLGRRINGH